MTTEMGDRQFGLFVTRSAPPPVEVAPLKTQLLKWIGNKQRFAHEIVGQFPARFGTYFEPFLGSGAVLATLAPERAVASDRLAPLIDLFEMVNGDPQRLISSYRARWQAMMEGDKVEVYLRVRADYNENPNPFDLLFLARSAYGGVIRFSKRGVMNTPCGAHRPVSPESFGKRVALWRPRIAGTRFVCRDFETAFEEATSGDLVYCDPPYKDSESTLYGAQGFSLGRLLDAIDRAKTRGVLVALSIDGTKRSGRKLVELSLPDGLFETVTMVNCGRSMLRRFQMEGQTLEEEVVADRLLLTYDPSRLR